MVMIGKSVARKDAWEKVTGQAKYTGDSQEGDMLYVEKVISPYGHALIKKIDLSRARQLAGVKAVITGGNLPLTGEEIRDRYPIAYKRVRYHGEVVALVVADTPKRARQAADTIHITYAPLPVINTPRQALDPKAPLIHEDLGQYKKISKVYPEQGTNIANRTKIRKGNMLKGWSESDVVVEESYSLRPSDHAAMETRCALASIRADGKVFITSSSQAPFMIKRLISEYFGIDIGDVIVTTPLVGGGYGGKASVQLELLAYIASRASGGRLVKVQNTREEDMLTSPCHIGLDATIKLGCSQKGKLKAVKILYLWDGGAYSDKAVSLSRAGAVDCTGPYQIENVSCDSLCMYTNHPYASPYRGYSHSEVLFAFERTMDSLANKLGMDPLELRRMNAILPGHTTPTQVLLNSSSVGNLPACIHRLKKLMEWEKGQRIDLGNFKVKAKGISCVWKTSTIDTNASSGVILIFNPDGSVNLVSGVIEIGTGSKTILAQIVSERLKINLEKVKVQMKVNTQSTPEHWKTVASRGTFMAGRAALQAADDAISQLKHLASCVLRAPVEDFEIGGERVFLRDDPSKGLSYKELAYGYTYPNGNAIGGQIIGRGHYVLRHLTPLNPETGAGKPGPEWTVGAQGVEVELDTREYTYRITKSISVIDAGKVMNPKMAEGQITGAMSMGLAFGGRETFYFDDLGRVMNPQLRTYRPLRYGENPEYVCEFIETPQKDSPYGLRGLGEHGLLGMPAALGNSLSLAAGVHLNELPLLPELIWRKRKGADEGDLL
ncbi:xanthine dehydrogenase family protein molybdopterin-binding subunit [Domibacillus epiphyticus]|uniref:Aldehyde oxidase n=1 Tax=Domibacillus epiphyticus TaxID=1714355 RepID=A0A1V2A5Z2_9BACI|nr:xanthine dehydrogenase family protein molybdopterin-binding subunit [Domibacillus epiphyticus]OMP66347.1 aldehyde oxidase [Domibacillus epiphyticus]